jgi:hypothetical protein
LKNIRNPANKDDRLNQRKAKNVQVPGKATPQSNAVRRDGKLVSLNKKLAPPSIVRSTPSSRQGHPVLKSRIQKTESALKERQLDCKGKRH